LTELLRNIWIFLKPIGLPKLIKRINKQYERTERFFARLESEKLTSTNNSRNLPSNPTIREEYVRCGKWDCPWCEHGPYYYAYWKENGKLHKKYIGKYPPPVEKANKNKSSHKDDGIRASRDTVTDDSNNSEGEI
jgi:hypothetical protein